MMIAKTKTKTKTKSSIQMMTLAALVVVLLLQLVVGGVNGYGYDASRYSPFSSLFHNPYDYADAESYGTNLFIKLYEHLNDVKRQADNCRNIPVPKTVLHKKYFNPEYEFERYKYWYPPREHLHVTLWAQNEALRNSLFLSYMLQDNNDQFPPGWLYLYLSMAAQLHSLQTIGYNSHRSVKGIKLPFESNEVFKVNWWKDKGMFQKFEKPFALYASQPRPNDLKYVRVVDFGTGGYATDYTGHAFIEAYIYDRQQFILNNTFEYSSFWKRPFSIEEFRPSSSSDYNANIPNNPAAGRVILSPDDPNYKQQEQKIEFVYQQGQQNAYNYYRPDLNVDYLNNNQNSNANSQASSGSSSSSSSSSSSGGGFNLGAGIFSSSQQQQQQQAQVYNTAAGNNNPNSNSNHQSVSSILSEIVNNNPSYHNHPNAPPQGSSYANYFQTPSLHQQQLQDPNVLPITLKPRVHSLDQYSAFVYQYKDKVPITNWDPIVDNDRNNLNRYPDRNSVMGFDQWYIDSLNQNIGLENLKNMEENPFVFKTLKYIDTYRFAKPWWSNETYFVDNKQEYVFRIKPEERYYKFTGAKFETGTSWTPPYFWCVDPSNWLVTAKAPIWATNDFQYRNKIFFTKDTFRFVGLSEVVLNYEEVDVNQCPMDRQLNAFGSTALCDSTAECLPLPFYGLTNGGYECQCVGGFHYPADVQGPYRGKELGNNMTPFPLCLKSEGLLQYPNWVSKNAFENPMPSMASSSLDYNYNHFVKRRDVNEVEQRAARTAASTTEETSIGNDTTVLEAVVREAAAAAATGVAKTDETRRAARRQKRFLDRRNNFEKLRDSIFGDQENLVRRCNMMPFQDVILFNEDDERFILNLRNHADQVFKPQTAQAIRIAHLISAYLQLHSPFGTSSVNNQNEFTPYTNFDYNNLRPDPQLEEHIMIGEAMSTLMANYPLQEVNIFFNGTEYERQKFFASQTTLAFGLSAIRSDIELILNRTNDGSHLRKSWYMYSNDKFMWGGGTGKTVFGGPYRTDEEKSFFKTAGPFDNGLFGTGFRLERYGIEMNMRRTFDGQSGNVDLPPKFYDAPATGVWYGPYYDCQKRYMKTKTTLRMVYSVPIITSVSKLPIGFTSVVIGSDLKWWRINPCETSRDKNMFQNSHKCDPDTTVCMYQDVPEFETGYYLASYKCVCKANYEFPFIDYGSSYFEGGTVEKEYEKKVKGLPNIFERLKCRPLSPSASKGTGLYSHSSLPPNRLPSTYYHLSLFVLFYASLSIHLFPLS